MSNVQIPNLPAATGLSGSEQYEGVQAGTSVRISTSQIAAYINAAYPAPGIATVSGSAPISVSTVGSAATVSLNLQGVTNAYMATMAAGTVKANVTVGSASPTDATPSQVLDVIGSGGGSLLYRGASSWAALSAGTAGQLLVSGGTGAPSWQTLSVPSGQIAPTGVVAGTYGSASTSPQYTVLASGQLSAASNVPIVIPSTSVTGLGTMATQNANTVAITGGTMNGVTIGGVTPAAASFTTLNSSGATNLGTIQSGVWNGTPIPVLYGGTGATTASGARANLGAAASGANSDITSLSGLTTPLSAPQGGTGFGSYTTGDLLVANTSSTLARLNDVATGNALISGGVGVGPSYGKIGLTTHVSGTLPVANGGSGAATLTGFLKGNGTSAFTAQATIGNADLTNSSITVGSTSIALGATSATLAGLTTVTLTQDPTLALQAATKQYVDNEVLSVSNTTFHTQSAYATTADLGTVTYNNGTSGVGATITQSGSPSVLIIDGYTFTAGDVTNATRVLVKNQSSGLQNGIYTVANEGSGAANWQLIRATDFNTVGTGPNRVQTGASTFVTGGAANGSTGWVMNVDGTIIIGTTPLVWVQSSSSSSVTVTSPLVKVGSVISLGTVPATLGGTGLTTLTQYGVMLGNGTGNVAFASPGTSGLPLLSTGASSNPAFGQLSLTAGVTGTLPVTNGGTGTATAFTAGSVVFAGASGVYSQNNAEFFWNNTNDFLGLGTASPDTRLTITAPTQTAVTAGTLPAGTDLHIVGADSAITRITQDAFGTGNYPAYTGRAARGTAASPTATQSGDVLSQYGGRGRGATDYSSTSVARIDLEAAENFTDTAQGSFISLHTTALGAASPVERFRVGPAGQWGIGGATYGTSGQVFTSGGASAAPSWTTLSATSLTGVLPVANGGTNISSYTVGDLLYADGTTSLAKLADVATGNALISGGIGVAPSYGKIGLSTHVSGTLPIGNGGTGVTGTPTNGQLLIGNGTGYSLAALTASTGISVTNGSGSITIANTGVTSLIAGTAISVSAATGGVTVNNTGVTSIVAGTNISISGGTGAVTVNTTATPTFATSVTSPLIIGGTTASSSLTLQSTSGAGTSDAIIFQTGSQSERMRISTSGQITIGAGTVGAPALSTTGDTNTGMFFPAADTIAFAEGGVEAMRIDALGRVGIGTSSPSNKLVVESSALNIVVSSSTGSYGAFLRNSASGQPSYDFYQTNGTETGRITVDSSSNMAFATGSSATERMRIDSFGNVGIGATAVAGVRLQIQQDQAAYTYCDLVNVTNGGGAVFRQIVRNIANTGTTSVDYAKLIGSGLAINNNDTNAANFTSFGVGGTERMRIDSSGNVGIGLSNPGGYSGKLAISGSVYSVLTSGETVYGWNFGSYGNVFIFGRQSDKAVGLYDGVTASLRWTTDTAGNFTAAGNVTAYSDARLKKNVSTIDNALELVEKMRGVRYERIDSGKAGVGVIAQEMQEVLPEVVQEGENLSVAYGNLVGVLIEAVKELSARVKELEAR
jgi:hypothetical protein